MKTVKSFLAVVMILIASKFSSAQSTTKQADLPASFKTSLNQMLSEYLEIEEALMAGNTLKAGEEGEELNNVTAKVSTEGLTTEQVSAFKKQADKIQHNAQHITENNKNYSHQCEHFDYLTDEFYALVKSFSFNNKTIYYNYTKEGNEGNSAHWLSDKADLSNPYFKRQKKTTDKQAEVIQPK